MKKNWRKCVEYFSAEFGIDAHFIAADLAVLDTPEMVYHKTQALGLRVDVLINNAGIDVYAPFDEADWEAIQTTGEFECLCEPAVNAPIPAGYDRA